jgi:hypothetical protein
VPALVESIYAGVDPRLHAAARYSVLAHLEAMIRDGEVFVSLPSENPFEARYALRDASGVS